MCRSSASSTSSSRPTSAKRANIRANVEAWLAKPDLGVIPLFWRGQQYFYYAQQVQRRTGAAFQIWGNNRLERSDFKTGFCGFDRGGYKDNSLMRMGARHNAQILAYYGKQFLTNRGYLNRSIPDTLFSYFMYYVAKLEYLDFFDYIPWNESEIVSTIIEQYGWETATDTASTWRIGDGTAAFYNFIYWTVAGFTRAHVPRGPGPQRLDDARRSAAYRREENRRAGRHSTVLPDDRHRPRACDAHDHRDAEALPLWLGRRLSAPPSFSSSRLGCARSTRRAGSRARARRPVSCRCSSTNFV